MRAQPHLSAIPKWVFLGIICLMGLGFVFLSPIKNLLAQTNTLSDAPSHQTKAQNLGQIALPLKHPRIVVYKSMRALWVLDGDTKVRQYSIALGFQPTGYKTQEGDGATPEGEYFITHKNPNSNYYLSLGISYPNETDAKRALSQHRIDATTFNHIIDAQRKKIAPPQKTALGGEVFIHGRGSSRDWTWGCIALDDVSMKELFDLIPKGTPIRILP